MPMESPHPCLIGAEWAREAPRPERARAPEAPDADRLT